MAGASCVGGVLTASASGLLPTAYCLLLIAYCLLAAGNCTLGASREASEALK
jgi:hypothetical protein